MTLRSSLWNNCVFLWPCISIHFYTVFFFNQFGNVFKWLKLCEVCFKGTVELLTSQASFKHLFMYMIRENPLFFFFLISYIRHPHSLKTIFYLIWFDVSVTFTLKSGISHLTGDHFFPCLYTPKVHITIASCHVLFSSSFFSRVISVWGIQTVLVFVFYHHVI